MVLSVQPSIEQAEVEARQQKHQHKTMRLRGGGAAKDCFLSMVECFLCFECCKDCCECWADIICCPCELCC
ncbi:hypothetical protein M422DRAFT_237156 [Sphaerobolus stellatus SS14]|uniref:Uncharacterized protein n=1 Tax=Sphaerobolus stellatus (strain SS14) TaxID=990650 RepID=A0A0C9UJ11_SPHS4|nr:hypothetical protein M422DRAFT_237156 [Sphaerobolus stellatus SS14]